MINIFVFIIGIAAGFIDSTAGEGGLISIPFLIFLGFPPIIAITTDRVGTLGQIITALIKFGNAKKIIWKYVFAFSVMSLVGSTIGANILLHIPSEILQKIIGLTLLILLFFIFSNKDLAVKKIQTNSFKRGLGFVLYFIIMTYNGMFGAGVGPFSTYNLIYSFGLTMIESFATNLIPWLILSLSSLVVFANKGIVDYKNGLILFIGMAIGGYFGAHVALKKGDKWVKNIFAFVTLFAGIKLLFF